MIIVGSPLAIERQPRSGWEIIFWLGKPFDFNIPFRATLAEIVDLLKASGPAPLDLPLHENPEDFIEGTLLIGGEVINVYFEHSLGYLALSSESKAPLEDILSKLRPNVQIKH